MFTRQPVFADLKPSITITSPVRANLMPVEYTQDGPSTFPPLSWANPPGTKELLLVIEDPDAPLPKPIVHGFGYAIPPSVQSIDSEDFDSQNPKYAEKGIKTGVTREGTPYAAPRPLMNHGPHRYFYQVIALRDPLQGLSNKPSTVEVLAVLKRENILGWGEWVGVAERRAP